MLLNTSLDTWNTMLTYAKKNRLLNTTWQSPKKKKKYFIKDVKKDQIIIGREAGNDSRLKKGYYFQRLKQINKVGGKINRRDFKGSVAKMAAMVHLHPLLDFVDNNDTIIVQNVNLGVPRIGKSNTSTVPNDDPEERQLFARNVRRGQPKFRKLLLAEYDNRCCITGTHVVDVLQAAHIDPHSRRGNNQLSNGLLLRSDIHDLFDSDLIIIEPGTALVHVHPDIRNSEYGKYHMTTRVVNRQGNMILSQEYLSYRWQRKPW